MNKDEANYGMVKGTFERNKIDPDKFNDTELKVFFRANEKAIKKLRKKGNEDAFKKIKVILKKYVDTSDLNYNLLAIWTLGTFLHEQFETYPLLTLMARKQSGKTRTLKLLSSLSSGSDGSTSTAITETFLFRHKGGALFFDEMETISSKEKTALRETINAIYKRGNKIVRYREVNKKDGNDYEAVEFFPYYPLGLANIFGFGDILTDRSLQIILQRSDKKQSKLIEDFSSNPDIVKLKTDLQDLKIKIPVKLFHEWNKYIETGKTKKEFTHLFYKIAKSDLKGRPLELFFPLFVVANEFDVLDIVLNSASDYLKAQEGEYVDNMDDILNEFIINKNYEGYIPLSSILTEFKHFIENEEAWINSRWLGRALKRLGFVRGKRQVNGRTQYNLNINSTNTTNAINSTNSTNSTKKGEFVEFVEKVEIGEKDKALLNEDGSPIEIIKIDGKEFVKAK